MPVPSEFVLAKNLAESYLGFIKPHEFPVNITLIHKLRANVIIKICKLAKHINGYNAYDRLNNKWIIYLNEYKSVQMQRYTLLHEIYHVSNTQSMCESRVIFPLSYKKALVEHAADQFAEEILLPYELLKKYLSKYHNDLELISRDAFVPLEIVERRLIALGL